MSEYQYRLCTFSPADDSPDVYLVWTVKPLGGIDYYMDVLGTYATPEAARVAIAGFRQTAPVV